MEWFPSFVGSLLPPLLRSEVFAELFVVPPVGGAVGGAVEGVTVTELNCAVVDWLTAPPCERFELFVDVDIIAAGPIVVFGPSAKLG